MASKKRQAPAKTGRSSESQGAVKGKQDPGGASSKESASATGAKEGASARSSVSAARNSSITGKTSSAKANTGAYGNSLASPKSGKPAARGAAWTGGAAKGAVERKEREPEVVVRSFEPDRGVVVLEFKRRRERYTRERSPGQVVAMADYLRARRGFSSDQEMAELLQVHRTRLAAWKQGAEVPNAQNAQLLSYLAVVVNELEEFLDPDVIPDWLVTEQYALGGDTPVHALREGHLAEVLQAANATEHGAYV